MTQEQRDLTKRQIGIWKETGELLDQIKWEDLRNLSEEQSARDFAGLDCDSSLIWRAPDREDGAGLIEQQRWFKKAHAAR
ncbi:MAG: hypothetical protein SFU85_05965 [Candidatus Methylacidiphilales bacterium]|nr:hypothetical protein [Candidatus Methylacidiphilales bacterium]